MNKRFLLDSWALLAWLYTEKPASERIQKLIDDAADGRVTLMLDEEIKIERLYRSSEIE